MKTHVGTMVQSKINIVMHTSYWLVLIGLPCACFEVFFLLSPLCQYRWLTKISVQILPSTRLFYRHNFIIPNRLSQTETTEISSSIKTSKTYYARAVLKVLSDTLPCSRASSHFLTSSLHAKYPSHIRSRLPYNYYTLIFSHIKCCTPYLLKHASLF